MLPRSNYKSGRCRSTYFEIFGDCQRNFEWIMWAEKKEMNFGEALCLTKPPKHVTHYRNTRKSCFLTRIHRIILKVFEETEELKSRRPCSLHTTYTSLVRSRTHQIQWIDTCSVLKLTARDAVGRFREQITAQMMLGSLVQHRWHTECLYLLT
jgi:hypothetical protein